MRFTRQLAGLVLHWMLTMAEPYDRLSAPATITADSTHTQFPPNHCCTNQSPHIPSCTPVPSRPTQQLPRPVEDCEASLSLLGFAV